MVGKNKLVNLSGAEKIRRIRRIRYKEFAFDLYRVHYGLLLDGSFEECTSSGLSQESIYILLRDFSKEYALPTTFFLCNEKITDGVKIVYKNFCWSLYKDTMPPMYENYKYDFTYLGGFPRLDKLLVLSKLFASKLLDNALWSFGSLPKGFIGFKNKLELPKLPKILDYDKSIKKMKDCWSTINPKFYQNSRFSLVQESEMSDKTNRYTEKTYKCFWMKHPFILAGNYQTLKLLRKDGFKTFHPYIDESYDNIEDKNQRIDALIEQVRILSGKNIEQWNCFLNDVKPIVEHNYNYAAEISAKNYNENILNRT